MLKHFRKFLFTLQLAVAVIFLSSCTNEIKFEQSKWKEKAGDLFPSNYRAQMLNDLITSRKLVGLNYHQLIMLLGSPDHTDVNSMTYRIVVDYGSDIDPVYSKDLEFLYSKDSVVTSFEVKEWKN